jgi:hypothetical protein
MPKQEASLVVGNVKRVWGAQASEEIKAAEVAQTTPTGAQTQGQNLTAVAGSWGSSAKPAAVTKPAPPKTKADRKKERTAASLFGGISSSKKDSSDSSDDDDSEATPTKPAT